MDTNDVAKLILKLKTDIETATNKLDQIAKKKQLGLNLTSDVLQLITQIEMVKTYIITHKLYCMSSSLDSEDKTIPLIYPDAKLQKIFTIGPEPILFTKLLAVIESSDLTALCPILQHPPQN